MSGARRPPPGALRGGAPSLREVREAYDDAYGRSPFGDAPRFYRMVAARALAARSEGPMRALDVGCGAGGMLRALRDARPGDFAVGLDISRAALAEARRRAPEARLILAQGERLPLPDRSFHLVFCLGNLEHFLDPDAGAREIARVLRPDGHAWFLLPNSFYSGDIWRAIRTGYGAAHHQIIERFATENEWRDLLEASELEVLETLPYNRFKWWKRLLPRALAYHFLYRTRRSASHPA